MNFDFIYEALVILPVGMILLRFAGKKTLAEMTGLEIITTLAIGTLIGHAVREEGVLKTIAVMFIIVLFLVLVQLLVLKMRWLERMMIGKPTLVVCNGEILPAHLNKLRMTQQQLEMRLRQKGITSLSQVQTATIEANGQLGFELKKEAKPLTIGELNRILQELQQQPGAPGDSADQADSSQNKQDNLFTPIVEQQYAKFSKS